MVNRCVCLDCSFSEIIARHNSGQSLSDIVKETGCGTNCGMCQPYIKLAILTNKSKLDINSVKIHKNEIAKFNKPDGW